MWSMAYTTFIKVIFTYIIYNKHKDSCLEEMIKPLLRVIPSYSGNVKISCKLADYTYKYSTTNNQINTDWYECNVRGATLEALNPTYTKKKISCGMLSSSYEYDLKKFYEHHKDTFFNSNFDYSKYIINKIDKTIPNLTRNVYVEMGVDRHYLTKDGYTLEFFAPIWIDDVNSLPDAFNIYITIESSTHTIKKAITIGLNETTKKNYLPLYLNKYLNNVTKKCIKLSSTYKNCVVYGIDLLRGGMTYATNNNLSAIYTDQQTNNNFDCYITSSFTNKKIAMAQILPLSFAFDLDDLLDAKEKILSKNCKVTISGRYIKDNAPIQYYDFSADYTKYTEQVLKCNDLGSLSWTSGNVSNLMTDTFPSLEEANILDYQFSNKITKMYSRWKMQQSEDAHPYIMNLDYAFNRNQESPYIYGQFPNVSSKLNGLAIQYADDYSKYNYSFIFPLGDDNTNYEGDSLIYRGMQDEYKEAMNKYQYNWFDILTDDKDFTSLDWVDVILDNAYYKGILYDLSKIYNKLKTNKEKIDKFAVFIDPTISITTKETSKGTVLPEYIIEFTTKEEKNCYANSNLINSIVSNGDADYYWLYSSEGVNSKKNATITNNTLLYKKYEDVAYSYWTTQDNKGLSYAYIPSQYDRYINPTEIGIDLDSINDYLDQYDVNDTFTYISSFINTSNINSILKSEKYGETYKNIDANIISDAVSIIKNSSSLYNISSNGNVSSTYYIEGYEINSLHNLSCALDDDAHLIMDVPFTYYVNTYYISMKCYSMTNGRRGDDYTYTEYTDPNNINIVVTQTCAYNVECDWSKDNRIPKDILSYIDNKTAYTYNNEDVKQANYAFYYETAVKNNKLYKDSIAYLAYFSNTNNYSKLLGTYIDKEITANSYIWTNTLTNTSYNTSLYTSNKFLRSTYIDRLEDMDVATQVSTFLQASTKSIYNDEELKEKNVKLLTNISYIIQDTINEYIDKKLENARRYKYMPILFNGSSIYSNNSFIYKDKEFYGNVIEKKNLNKDIDFLWVSIYNMSNVMKKAKKDDSILLDSTTFKTKFLNKQHLYWWYVELAKNHERWLSDKFSINWYTHVSFREKVLVLEDNRIVLKDKIIPFNKTKYDTSFKKFYESIEYDEGINLWKNKETQAYFELLFDCPMVRMNKDIYELANIDENTAEQYKDLYIFKPERQYDWENNYSNYLDIHYIGTNTSDTMNLGNIMEPLFNAIYQQNKTEALVVAHYELGNISTTKILNNGKEIDNAYRYDSYNVNTIVELTDEVIESLSTPIHTIKDNNIKISKFQQWMDDKYGFDSNDPFAHALNMYLYRKVETANVELSKDYDELEYGIENFCTRKINGINYGYYRISMNVTNTINTLNMIGQSEINTSTDSSIDYTHTSIKYVKYINKVNVETEIGQSYIKKILRSLMPFIKISPYVVLSQIDTLIEPKMYNINMKYELGLDTNTIDKNNQPIEKNLLIIDKSTSYKLQRYLDCYIVPLIIPIESVENCWNLKYKYVNENLLDTGKYISINDSCLWKSNMSIQSYLPMKIYTTRENNDLYIPLEYKHMNASRFIYLIKEYTYIYPRYIVYDKIIELESEENTLEVFKSITNLKSKGYDDDEILFLYKYYTVSYDTTSVGANSTSKLWKLKYIFNLI